MAEPNKAKETVKTTETAFAILELLQEMNGARVSEAANQLGMAKSTLHRHLTTLEKLHYVVKEGDTYHLSLRFLFLGSHTQKRKKGFTMIEPKVKELAEETNERAHFIVEEHGKGIYVYREVGEHAIRTDRGLGTNIPLHTTASGKVILAYLPETRTQEIIETEGLYPRTDNTITASDDLYKELKAIRERGVGFNDSENIKGERAVAAPVKDASEHVIGALNVVGPAHRMKGDWFKTDIPDLLQGAANELELNIAHA